MKCTQKEVIDAYKSILDLNRQKFSSGIIAKKIYELLSQLKPVFDFQIQEEQKIFASHPKFDRKFGGIKIEDPNDAEEKQRIVEEIAQVDHEFEELMNIETEIDFEPFEIDLEQNPNLNLSGEDIGNLKPFITFI